MNILVFGAGGMLGEAFKTVFPKATLTDINGTLETLDVRDFIKVKGTIKRYDVVVNLAAITDMEQCEHNLIDCYETNYLAENTIADLCRKYGKHHVYISTAGIFYNETKNIFTDKDIPNPQSHYAISKYLGELGALKWKQTTVVRAGWMMGGGKKHDKKFIGKLLRQIDCGCKELFVVDDKYGIPTYTYDFVKGLRVFVEKQIYGVFNQVCLGEPVSRVDIAKYLLKCIGREDIIITPVKSEYFASDYFAKRPPNEALQNSSNITTMRDWKICLKEYCTSMGYKCNE